MAESKNKKMLVKTKIDLEIEKEKTRQMLLLRDIKKMELKIIGQEKYNKKNDKSLDLFNQLDSVDINIDTISMCSSKSGLSKDEIEVNLS